MPLQLSYMTCCRSAMKEAPSFLKIITFCTPRICFSPTTTGDFAVSSKYIAMNASAVVVFDYVQTFLMPA